MRSDARTGTPLIPRVLALLAAHWPLVLGLAVVVIPTMVRLAQQNWTRESGVQGPIILATGLWIFFFHRATIAADARPGSTWLFTLLAIPVGLAYIFGRAFGFLLIEVGALLAFLALLFYLATGITVVRKLWFGIVYLGFVIPLPGWFEDRLTGPLKMWVSAAVTNGLSAIGYPVMREGVVIYVAQYQLLVEDACAGLNSLTSLLAISLLYIYLTHQASVRYALFLTLWIFPVAVLANMVRVTILVLITYYFGDEAAQSFIHGIAGMLMFTVALLGIIAIDSAVWRFVPREGKWAPHAV